MREVGGKNKCGICDCLPYFKVHDTSDAALRYRKGREHMTKETDQ
jgi:hypothetical protein